MVKKALPPTPKRAQLENPKNETDIIQMLIYYEYLVQEWEAWGETAQKIVSD